MCWKGSKSDRRNKGTVARFLDKRADSGEVAKLVDQLRGAMTHYQMSERRFLSRTRLTCLHRFHNSRQSTNGSLPSLSVFFGLSPFFTLMVGPLNIESSFDTLLRLDGVIQFSRLVNTFADT